MVMKKYQKLSLHKKVLIFDECELCVWTSCIGHWTHDHLHGTPFGRLQLPAVRPFFHPSSGGRAVETETSGYKDKRVHRVTRELGSRSGIPFNILGDIRSIYIYTYVYICVYCVYVCVHTVRGLSRYPYDHIYIYIYIYIHMWYTYK